MDSTKGTAMVTGALSGMGTIYADRLGRRGYHLVLVDRDCERLNDLARRLTEETGRAVEVVAADLRGTVDIGKIETQLRRVMGPVPSPKGFSGAGTFSPDTLCCGLGEGMLDGILFRNGNGSVLVTTERLLRLWLQEHKNWWKDNPLATDAKTALTRRTPHCSATIGPVANATRSSTREQDA